MQSIGKLDRVDNSVQNDQSAKLDLARDILMRQKPRNIRLNVLRVFEDNVHLNPAGIVWNTKRRRENGRCDVELFRVVGINERSRVRG